ncbi:MAG: hypothetical protein RLZZ630_687 [Bacteroidota bacterium]|jgi:hypothetical protein
MCYGSDRHPTLQTLIGSEKTQNGRAENPAIPYLSGLIEAAQKGINSTNQFNDQPPPGKEK